MKWPIPLVPLLAVVLCLSGCADRHDLPTVPPTSAMEDLPQAAESEKSTEMTTEETTMPEIDTTEPILLLTIDGTAVDVQWENNAAVAELYALAKKAIIVNTSAYGGFEQVGSLPQSFSRSDTQLTTQPGDIVLYSGNQLVVFFGSNSWSYTKLGHIYGLSADELTVLLDKEQTVIEFQQVAVFKNAVDDCVKGG